MERLINIIKNRIKEAEAGLQRGDIRVNVTGYSEEYVAGRIYEATMILDEARHLTDHSSRRKKTRG